MYQLPNHPQAAYEAQHLVETRAIIDDEIQKLEEETGIGAREERIVVVPQNADMDEQVALNLLRMKLEILHQLALAQGQPYFSRLDFIPMGGKSETHYLGRWGVTTTPDYQVEVVDWRSPVANLYYSGQVGPMSYTAPDGTVEGELTLKRMFTIRDCRLEGMFDSGVVSQDAYLQGVLGQVSSDRLREIVTTIQAEQNIVIRYPVKEPLIVQGVAGSGKTTIALHRIAWLLYAYQQYMAPEQMMIIAPNPLFLNYISQVLPDLGVERVRQTTYSQLCSVWLGKQMPSLLSPNRLEDKISMSGELRHQMGAVLEKKGSLAFKQELEGFLDGYEQRIFPKEAMTFGRTILYTPEDIANIFLVQLRPFPFAVRVSEMKKYLRTRLKAVGREMAAWLEGVTQEKLSQLLNRLPDGEERRTRARKLFESRDERLKEIGEKEKEYLKSFPALWPDMGITAIYREFLEKRMEQGLDTQGLWAATEGILTEKKAYPEDLPALVIIMKKVWGLPKEDIRHVVIDEAQDFSPFQIKLLQEIVGHESFTMVGDLQQGIHQEEGISGWDEISGPIFHGHAKEKQLVTSYRNTVEIMNFASSVNGRHPILGQAMATPVLRHGEAPRIVSLKTEKERVEAIASQTEAWQKEGFHTIALIEKSRDQAKKLYQALKRRLPVRLFSETDTEYQGGILILPAAMVKGLEFDCVLICQADEASYPDEAFACRLLYVLLTRPLHRLVLCHTGVKSPLVIQKGMQE